jgi:hypothetical protein
MLHRTSPCYTNIKDFILYWKVCNLKLNIYDPNTELKFLEALLSIEGIFQCHELKTAETYKIPS